MLYLLYLSTYINLYLNFSISGFIINLSQSAMHSSPETTQLTQIFKQLDKQKQGYLTLDQFAAYLDHQPRKVPLYLINDFFNTLPQSRMNEQAFICYVMGYRLNLQHLAVARFAMQKQFRKHASASPPSGANQVRKNRIKFHVMSKQKTTVGEKHSLVLKVGHDQREQSQKYEQLEQMLGQKPDEIVGIIKFKVSGAHQQIRQGFETILETAKGNLSEMDEDLFKIIDLFKFSVKANGNYIYIIIQVGHVFLTDFVSFINEFIQSISPQALFNFSFGIHSNYFRQFLKQGGEKKMQDLEVNLKLNIDNESLKKLKEIISEKIQIYDDQQKFVSLFIMLIQQISFDASFNNSQKLFNKLGVSQLVEGVKPQLGALKDLMLFENLEGFIPESKQLIENLKKYAKGDGEISINLRSLYVQLEFNVEVEGFFDLF